MIFKCLVNGAIDEEARAKVIDGLAAVSQRRLGTVPDAVVVEFTEIPEGYWFTAGRPSVASMVLSSVPHGTEQSLRVEVMADICAAFSAATGVNHDDVMVVAADSAPKPLIATPSGA